MSRVVNSTHLGEFHSIVATTFGFLFLISFFLYCLGILFILLGISSYFERVMIGIKQYFFSK